MPARRFAALLLPLGLLTLPPVPAAADAPVRVGPRAALPADAFSLRWPDSQRRGKGRGLVVSDSTGRFPEVLRVTYPKGGSGGGAGVNFTQPVQAADAARLSYFVRFQGGFQFVKGGKLPGLCGGNCPTGGETADPAKGWSMRLMWRKGGDGEVYLYVPRSSKYGVSLGRGEWRFTPGPWHHVVTDVRLNTPGRSDGSVTVWIDDLATPAFTASGLRFRSTSKLKVDKFLFSTFFGGHTRDWAPGSDQRARFADVRVQPLEG